MLKDESTLFYGKRHLMLRNGDVLGSKYETVELLDRMCAENVFSDGELVTARYYGDEIWLNSYTTDKVCSDDGIYPQQVETQEGTVHTMFMEVTPGEKYRIVCENKGNKFNIFAFDEYTDPETFENNTPIEPFVSVDMPEHESDYFDYMFEAGENTHMVCVSLADENCDTVNDVSGHHEIVMALIAECIKDVPTRDLENGILRQPYGSYPGYSRYPGCPGYNRRKRIQGYPGPSWCCW